MSPEFKRIGAAEVGDLFFALKGAQATAAVSAITDALKEER